MSFYKGETKRIYGGEERGGLRGPWRVKRDVQWGERAIQQAR